MRKLFFAAVAALSLVSAGVALAAPANGSGFVAAQAGAGS